MTGGSSVQHLLQGSQRQPMQLDRKEGLLVKRRDKGSTPCIRSKAGEEELSAREARNGKRRKKTREREREGEMEMGGEGQVLLTDAPRCTSPFLSRSGRSSSLVPLPSLLFNPLSPPASPFVLSESLFYYSLGPLPSPPCHPTDLPGFPRSPASVRRPSSIPSSVNRNKPPFPFSSRAFYFPSAPLCESLKVPCVRSR